MRLTSTSVWAGVRLALLAAAAPWFLALACGDDASSDDGGPTAGSGGLGGSAGAGTGGNAGAAGSATASAGSSGSGGGNAAGAGGGGTADAGNGGGDDLGGGTFTLTSPAVEDLPGCGPDDDDVELCDLFPAENTGLGGAENVSPQFDWTGVPAGTQSFAIALRDLSNQNNGDFFTHWVMWNIPGTARGLPAELPPGREPGVPSEATRQVSFLSSQNDGYAGSGAPGNVYEFVLYALDVASIDPMSDDPDDVEAFILDSDDVLLAATLRARSNPED